DLTGPAQPFEGAHERIRGQPVASQPGVELEVEPGRDARALGGGGQTVEAVDRRDADLDAGPHRLVEVSGRSVEPGEDLGLVAEQAAQLQGFGDRGHTEFAPPGREEGGSDEVDAMAVGIGLDDASEAGGGESGGQHCGIVAQGRLVDLRPDQGRGDGGRCHRTSVPPPRLTGGYRDPGAVRGLGYAEPPLPSMPKERSCTPAHLPAPWPWRSSPCSAAPASLSPPAGRRPGPPHATAPASNRTRASRPRRSSRSNSGRRSPLTSICARSPTAATSAIRVRTGLGSGTTGRRRTSAQVTGRRRRAWSGWEMG